MTHDAERPIQSADETRWLDLLSRLIRLKSVSGAPRPTGDLSPACFHVTDASHRSRAGMQGVVFGPGGRYNTMPDERVDAGDYLDAIRINILAAVDLCA